MNVLLLLENPYNMAKVLTTMKTTLMICNFSIRLTDNDITMHIDTNNLSSKPQNKILFVADKQSFFQNLFYLGGQNYDAEENHMNVFKEIEIICNDKELCKIIETRFVAKEFS
jgi:hypothetical protein